MSNLYYIDGYNVVHHSSLLRPLAFEDFESARETLIDKVAQFCVISGKRATIVFDGRGKHHYHPEAVEHFREAPGLEVLYSPTSLSADAVIERLVYRAPNRLEVVVVSNDRGLRDLCRNLGALTMEADYFLSTMQESKQQSSASLQDTRRQDNAPRIEDNLDPETRARLEALKKRLK
jgi:predicted RNA-binding protein with PIN domain